MTQSRLTTDRRSFIKVAAPFALCLPAIVRAQTPVERGRFNDNDIPLAREQLLKMVNEERAHAGLRHLRLDDLACEVANEHAREMVRGEFLSHWGRDGRKPYQRYSFAGGTDAVQENVSSADDIPSVSSNGVLGDLRDMHQSMIDEVAPIDGHRKAILFPQHTHVGFGVAAQGYRVRLDELYLARYVEIDPIPRRIKRKGSVFVRGRLLNSNHILTGAQLYYEPLPSPPTIDWLRTPLSYGMPSPAEELILPRLLDGYSYPEGGRGSIDFDGIGRFHFRVALSKRPGINTIMLWLKAGPKGTPFPATQICFRVE